MNRIHGSYEALHGGKAEVAMRDFTGGISEMYKLDKVPTNLFTIMLKSFQRQSLMCGSIYKDKLVRYSILYKIEFFLILSRHHKLYKMY